MGRFGDEWMGSALGIYGMEPNYFISNLEQNMLWKLDVESGDDILGRSWFLINSELNCSFPVPCLLI
jgi:hypothetical protein